MEIEWRDIPGYQGYYQVSNTGEVRSLDRVIYKSNGVAQLRRGRILPAKTNSDGYIFVRLSKESERRQFAVHILVAKAFVPGYFDGAEVNHKDYDRTNNYPDNLEWVTHEENVAHTIAGGRHVSQIMDFSGERNPNYGNRKLSKRYASDPELAKAKQSRKGVRNGRCIPIRMITPDGKERTYGYLTACAVDLINLGICAGYKSESVAVSISKAAKSGKRYRGCEFTYIN